MRRDDKAAMTIATGIVSILIIVMAMAWLALAIVVPIALLKLCVLYLL